MNQGRFLIVELLALAVALVTIGASCIWHIRAPNPETSVDVVVAIRNLGPEERIGEGDIKIAKLGRTYFPPACFHDKSLVVGHRVILPIAKGHILCPSNLATTDESDFRWPEMRAVSIAVGEIIGTTGFPEPGTRVDVVLSRTVNDRLERTTTVLKSVCEIVVAQGPIPGALRQAVSVVLLLSPDGAQLLAQARRRGQIRLSVVPGLPNCV